MPLEASIPSPLNAAAVSAELGIRGLRFIGSIQFRLASSSRPTEGSSDVKNDPDYRYLPTPPVKPSASPTSSCVAQHDNHRNGGTLGSL
jgi:hypothetical protein